MNRDYPAYGRTLARHVAMAQRPVVVVVLLSSRWGYFDHLPKVCIRPDEWRRGKFEFSYLRGLHVVAVPGNDCTEKMLGELLVDLMAAGPAHLWAWNVDGSKLTDDDSPQTMPLWVLELTRDPSLYRGAARTAIAIMTAVKIKALERSDNEYMRRLARSDEEAVAFFIKGEQSLQRVRELLSQPHRANESRAA